MTAKKRIMSIILTLVIVLTLIPVTAESVFAVDADIDAPEIDDASLRIILPEGKSEVTEGDSVKVSVKVTDDSGVSRVRFL